MVKTEIAPETATLIRDLNAKYGKGTWRSRKLYGYISNEEERLIERRNEFGKWTMVGWADQDADTIRREYLLDRAGIVANAEAAHGIATAAILRDDDTSAKTAYSLAATLYEQAGDWMNADRMHECAKACCA